jgi:hypothetical protein
MVRLVMVVAIATAVTAMGCGGDDGKPSVVSCELQDLPNTHWCYEFPGSALSAEQLSGLQAACQALTGAGETVIWSTQACPGSSAGGTRAGICAVPSSASVPWWYGSLTQGTAVKISYYDPPVNTAQGAIICGDHNGTWTQ